MTPRKESTDVFSTKMYVVVLKWICISCLTKLIISHQFIAVKKIILFQTYLLYLLAKFVILH